METIANQLKTLENLVQRNQVNLDDFFALTINARSVGLLGYRNDRLENKYKSFGNVEEYGTKMYIKKDNVTITLCKNVML